MSGILSGGWGFVVLAYAATALVVAGYATKVIVAYGRSIRNAKQP